ncbi:OmpA family protein [Spirosoma pollinicola]|uniref:Signaling protein n=1 Tax=Spirosoma pollinicola TaxID=2057025 RepID=A0A2K8Z0F4_9BACT|nr:PA14 domain-containing protein [Spirosoma pollinicola]AUD03362.1 signaling protein [Spirosoma pollinicola]
MKAIKLFLGLVFWLLAGYTFAQQGLKGEYYVGTNFERKVFTRMDPQLNFNWRGQSPAPGLPESYYSIRWTGKLLAPVSGQYRFYAKVDDGIRVWVGNKLVMNSWQLNDSENYGGNVILEAGKFYDFRVDFFNDLLEGEIFLYWQRPDDRKTTPDVLAKGGELISTQYFFQKAVPARVTVVKTPPVPIAKPPVVVAAPVKVIPAKAIPPKPVVSVTPNPTPRLSPPSTKTTAVSANTATTAAPKPTSETGPVFEPGATFVLHNVQFEQSSYTLLPESSTELDQVVAALKKNPLWHIDVAGHTDNIGDPRLNLALSENRAKVVSGYLKRRGITDDRITAIGYGGAQPIADNNTEGERSKNRRVEITIKQR